MFIHSMIELEKEARTVLATGAPSQTSTISYHTVTIPYHTTPHHTLRWRRLHSAFILLGCSDRPKYLRIFPISISASPDLVERCATEYFFGSVRCALIISSTCSALKVHDHNTVARYENLSRRRNCSERYWGSHESAHQHTWRCSCRVPTVSPVSLVQHVATHHHAHTHARTHAHTRAHTGARITKPTTAITDKTHGAPQTRALMCSVAMFLWE